MKCRSLLLALSCFLASQAFAADQATPVTVTVGTTMRLQMKGKQPIGTVLNQRESVARVTAIPDDPTTIQITGLQPGTTRITLSSGEADSETVALAVEMDTGLLRNLLQRVLPTATVTPVATGTTLTLYGFVEQEEDIATIMGICRNCVGGPSSGEVVNALVVGRPPWVVLDVVVVRVNGAQLERTDAELYRAYTAAFSGLRATTEVERQEALALLEWLCKGEQAKLLTETKLLTSSGKSAGTRVGQSAAPDLSGHCVTCPETCVTFLPFVLSGRKVRLQIESDPTNHNRPCAAVTTTCDDGATVILGMPQANELRPVADNVVLLATVHIVDADRTEKE